MTTKRSAYGAAVAALARRELSRYELDLKLRKAKFDRQEITRVLADCEAQGLQSDHRFAESYLRSRAANGYGPRRITVELKRKGVDDGVIRQAFSESEQDWQANAQAAHIKRFGLKSEMTLQEKARQVRFLEYRGFDSDDIRIAMEQRAC
ncbi:MAG: regulatory protein RecX [Pseudomonadota bacterium]